MVNVLIRVLAGGFAQFRELWPYLALGIILAAAIEAFIQWVDLKRWFTRSGPFPVIGATVAGVTTPLCSASTVGVMIPLLTAGVPWAPIMAWLLASPLISPNTFTLLSGALGLRMAVLQLLAAVMLGLGGGLIAAHLQRLGWLPSMVPDVPAVRQAPMPGGVPIGVASGAGDGSAAPRSFSAAQCLSVCGADMRSRPWGNRWRMLWQRLTGGSTRRLVRNFTLSLILASAVRELVPTRLVIFLFGSERLYSVPLAALLGVPLYTSNSSSVPLVQSLMALGMGRGPALALLIAGAGTSLPAIAGLLSVASSRAVALYVGLVFTGAVLFGYLVQLLG